MLFEERQSVQSKSVPRGEGVSTARSVAGVQVHENMINLPHSKYLIQKEHYTEPYLSIPKSISLIRTLPVICGYVMMTASYPNKLNILFPMWLKKLDSIIKMTNSRSSTISTPLTDKNLNEG